MNGRRSTGRHGLRACVAAVTLAGWTTALAAQGGQVADYPELGVRFTIPAGWSGRELDESVVLTSTTVPGLVVLLPHEHREIAALRAEAEGGIDDGAGTALTPHGALAAMGSSGISGEFRGRFDGAPATAYAVGLVNPHGRGLTVVAVTSPEAYTPAHRALALEVARSVEFSAPRVPTVVAEWRQGLSGRRLARYASSYGSGSGGYSGFQSSTQFHLCTSGDFVYGGRESGSFDTPGAFGSTGGGSTGSGRWDVIVNPDGSPWLQLRYHTGAVENYRLEHRGANTYLNGARYFRTASDRCR
ncbi:MAG: hypothetical protein AB7U25_22355 [Vicinamibacterales bacterium]